MAGKRASRDEWRTRVERWKDSGLTAKEFAAETGINAGTLQFWSYKLRKAAPSSTVRRTRRTPAPMVSSLVEVRPVAATEDLRFEIEFGNGRRLRVPTVFDSTALKALLAVMETTA